MAKILVVEDEPAIALGLKNDLKLEGYAVEVAGDGETALRRAGREAFDLILLDLMLPRKDGLAVCRELRHAGIRTPIIMLTAKAQEAEKVLGLELGADDYVTKPFSPLELRARVKAILRRASEEAPEVYRFGDVEVDLTRAEVRRAGAALDMTPLEFKLLATFIRRRGRLLTRERLLDEVWRPDSSPTDRVIDNHIMNLRRKIEPVPNVSRYIVSVRGQGYRFDG
ncbi:MAG: response regulator transcription factor [Candidatus Aminicenantes bacterium]|nr:response regulator transcription factor [Candidatus Aminicenantes bacterium]